MLIGNYLHCNASWSEVDNVLIPIMMEKKAHWRLADFDTKDRSLHVYNSSHVTMRGRIVIANLESFAYILPCLMVTINAWQPNVLVSIERVKPIPMKIATDIP